jgi:hypothetical protein
MVCQASISINVVQSPSSRTLLFLPSVKDRDIWTGRDYGMEHKEPGNCTNREEAMSSSMAADPELDRAKAIDVMAELYRLLEDYGPTWYTEDLHYQSEAALRALRERSASK